MKYLIALIIVGVIAFYQLRKRDNKLRQKSEQRSGFDYDDFIGHFTQKGYNQFLVETMYRLLIPYVPKQDFLMHPEDELMDDYHMTLKEIENLALDLHLEFTGEHAPLEALKVADYTRSPFSGFEWLLKFAQA
jgi:hypothetical protein